jgi:hypothetical protein
MPGNDVGAVVVPYTGFLGLNTDLNPADLPEGLSPDNQDIIYLPGEVDSRPGLHKLYPANGTLTVTYTKTYVKPDGSPINLILYSDGSLWKEDVLNSPGTLTQIGNVTPGSYCISVTTFGKEYMAFSNGINGTDIPRQFDGTNFDRISQDGPAAAPTVADINTTVALTSVTIATSVVINAATSVGGVGGGPNVATYTTATPHGLSVSQFFLVQGVGTVGYNGVFQVISVPSTTQVTITYAGAVLGASAGGTLGPSFATIVTGASHGMNVGDAFTFTGNAGTLNTSSPGNPSKWVVLTVISATSFTFGLINTFGILAGSQATTTGGAGGTLTPGGMISQGTHQCVQMFLTRQGFLTKPSPATNWVSSGDRQALVTNIAIGPANVIGRVLAFTGSGGSNFFTLLTSASIPNNSFLFSGVNPPTIVQAFLIPDNTTTQLNVDFPDNTLFAATGIGITGNNLFNLVTLGPCLGFFSFANRLLPWGEVNKVLGFVNMGFEGGTLSGAPTVPLGWTVATAGGALVTNPDDFGDAWQITGDGTANPKGQITQSAYQDTNNVPILEPNTQYTFSTWAIVSAASLAGNLIATLSSASTGFSATATIAVNTIPNTAGTFVSANFSAITPAVIPSDFLLKIHEAGMPNASTITIDENYLVFTAQPFNVNNFRASYINNPESFDGITGILGPSSDPNPIRCAGIIRKTMYIVTADRLHATNDTGQEPSSWPVAQIADQCGALSARCIDGGTSWLTWASDQGLLICDGSAPDKLSQEIQPDWNSINRAVQHRIWLVNDQVTKRIYVGLPTGSSTGPNLIYPLDYHYLDSEGQMSSEGAVHVTYAGRMSAQELARKWTRWNVKAHCGAIIRRPANQDIFVMGGGNGLAPGSGTAFGNVYYLDPLKFSDDDYGAFLPYYVSYAFLSKDQEEQFQVGSHRKLYTFLSTFVSGIGTLTITPYANTLTNPYPPGPAITLSLNQAYDFMYGINVEGSRMFLKFAVTPIVGTDVQFKLTQLAVDVMKHPISPVR